MFSNNFIKKVAAFGLVLCMGAGSLDLTTFAATPTETVETDTPEVVSTTGEDASADTDADVSVLSDKTVEEVSDLYTEDDLSEAAKTSNTAGLLVQLKDTEGTLPSITYNSTNSVNLSNGLYAVTFASTEKADAAKKEFSSNDTVSFVEKDSLVESEAEVVPTEVSSEETTEVVDDTELSSETEVTDTDTDADVKSDTETEVPDETVDETVPEESSEESADVSEQEEDATVKVAVLDSGVDYSNEKITPYIEDTGINLSASGKSDSTQDDNGHGTAMASALLDAYGEEDGITIYPVKVLDSNNRGTILSTYLGIKAAIDMDVDVINLSLSAKTQSKLLEEAVNEAYDKGIMVVGAAGNNGADLKDYAPANIMNAVIVSAVNAKKEVCAYSNYGTGLDFAAYGKYSDGNGATYRGTSVSAAKVSGILAKVMKEQPEADVSTLYQALVSMAEPLSDGNWNESTGYGLLGSIPADAVDEAEDLGIADAEEDVVVGSGSDTWYPAGTNGWYRLEVKDISTNTRGTYQIDLSIGSRCPNGVNYYLSYNMHLVGGTDMGLTIAPATANPSAFDEWNPAVPGHNPFFPNGNGMNCPCYYGNSYVTMYDNATSDVYARQYVFPITFMLNKPGYHLESADTTGTYQTYLAGYNDNTCSFGVDSNGCGVTAWGQHLGAYYNDTIRVQYVPNTYTVNFNGNGATGGSMAAQTMHYNTASAIQSNGFVKNCTATFDGNGGVSATGATTASCPFNGWYDYNDITVNGNTYHWWTFDGPYYAHTNADVANAFGYNKMALASHFDTYAVNGAEIRQASPVFNVGYYMNYGGTDLNNAFGSNKAAYVSHWNNYGYAEGRKGISSVDTSGRDVYPNGVTVVNLTAHRDAQLWLYASWGKAKVTLPSATRTGYQLVGWSTNKNATTAQYAVGQTVEMDANTTFYAVWQNSNPPKIIRIKNVQDGNDAFWTYVYVQDSGNGVARVQFPIWTAANGQDDIFPNWGTSTAERGTKGSWTIDGVAYNYRYHTETSKHNNEHTEYYTHAYAYDKYGGYSFIAGNFKFRYDVVVEKGDHVSDVSGGGTYYYDDPVTVTATLPTGYKFKEWTGTLTSTDQNFTFKLPVGGATLTATGAPIEYNVSFDGNGATDGSMDDIHLVYDEDSVLPPNQYKKVVDGQESGFAGWSTSPDTNPKDVEYKDGDTVKNLTTKDGDTVKLYAIWDDAPLIDAVDLYYSRDDANNGNITEEDILQYVYVTDKEDGSILPGEHEDGSYLKLTNISQKDFTPETVGVTETIEARDSFGNVVTTTIYIWIADTSVKPYVPGKIRFINEKYYYADEDHGGLSPDSVWKTDPEYVAAIKEAFRREKENDPQKVVYISAEEIQAWNKDLHERGKRETEERRAAKEAAGN